MRGGYRQVFLVNGIPALPALHLVRRLLEQHADARVYSLAPTELASRIESTRAKLDESIRRRWLLLRGDPLFVDWGLGGREYLELAESVDRVFHWVRTTDPRLSSQASERVNVVSARELAAFALAMQRPQSIAFYSSAMVSGDRRGLVLEDELEKGQDFRAPAEKSLACAELMLRRHMDRLPVCVFRPTHLTCHSVTGEGDPEDSLTRLVHTINRAPPDFTLPLSGRDTEPFHVVPVDYVVDASIHISFQSPAKGTFHLTDDHPASVSRALELIFAACGKRTQPTNVPPALSRILFRAPGLKWLLDNPKELLQFMERPAEYGTHAVRQSLGESDIRCPPFESYVDRWVAWAKSLRPERPGRPVH